MNIFWYTLLAVLIALVLWKTLYVMFVWNPEDKMKQKDERGKVVFWIKHMDARDLQDMVVKCVENDWDVYDHLNQVNKQSSELADAIREGWAKDATKEELEHGTPPEYA